MNQRAFSKIWIVITLLLFITGGFLAWQYFSAPKEKAVQTETKWKEYILEEITQDFESTNFMDRRLIGIRDDGKRDIIIANVKELMGWEKTPRETGYYPREVSFPPYSDKIFFVKHIAGTAHSAGVFMLDVNTLEFKKLAEINPIYENYYNYLNILSPDGFKIASYGYKDLYLLDLLQDKAILLAKTQAEETFYFGSETPEFQWLDNDTIQYPVHSAQNIYAPPIEIRQISVVKEETADWKTYENEEYGFEFKYPEDWHHSMNLSLGKPNRVFCSATFYDGRDCVWKEEDWKGPKPVSQIYLFIDDKTKGKGWQWCEFSSVIVDGKESELRECKSANEPYYIHVFIEKDSPDPYFYHFLINGLNKFPEYREIFNQILSTFKFLE